MIFTVQPLCKDFEVRKDNIITFDIVVKTFKSVVMKWVRVLGIHLLPKEINMDKPASATI